MASAESTNLGTWGRLNGSLYFGTDPVIYAGGKIDKTAVRSLSNIKRNDGSYPWNRSVWFNFNFSTDALFSDEFVLYPYEYDINDLSDNIVIKSRPLIIDLSNGKFDKQSLDISLSNISMGGRAHYDDISDFNYYIENRAKNDSDQLAWYSSQLTAYLTDMDSNDRSKFIIDSSNYPTEDLYNIIKDASLSGSSADWIYENTSTMPSKIFKNNVDINTDFVKVVNSLGTVADGKILSTSTNNIGSLVGSSTNYIYAEKNQSDNKRICFKILRIEIDDTYKYPLSSIDRPEEYHYFLNIDLPVIFLQDIWKPEDASFNIGWNKNDISSIKVISNDGKGDDVSIYIKNNTSDYLRFQTAALPLSGSQIPSDETTEVQYLGKMSGNVPDMPGTSYNPDDMSILSNVYYTGKQIDVDESYWNKTHITVGPNQTVEISRDITRTDQGAAYVHINDLNDGSTGTYYYAISGWGYNVPNFGSKMAEDKTGKWIGVSKANKVNSANIAQVGHTSGGSILWGTNASGNDYTNLPSWENSTDGTIGRNIKVVAYKGQGVTKFEWNVTVFRSFDVNAEKSDDITWTAADDVVIDMSAINSKTDTGESGVEIPVKFPENVRNNENGNISVMYKFKLTITNDSTVLDNLPDFIVYQQKPNFSMSPADNISAGDRSAKITNVKTTNPCVVRYLSTTNKKATVWTSNEAIKIPAAQKNDNYDITVKTAFSYDKADTVSYTYRIYAWPTVSSTPKTPEEWEEWGKTDTSAITYYVDYTITQDPGVFEVTYNNDTGGTESEQSDFSPFGSSAQSDADSFGWKNAANASITVVSSVPWVYDVETMNPDPVQGSKLQTIAKKTVIAPTITSTQNGTKYNIIIPKSYSKTSTRYVFKFSYADGEEGVSNVEVDQTSMETIEIIQRKAELTVTTNPGASGFSQDGGNMTVSVTSSNYWGYAIGAKGSGEPNISVSAPGADDTVTLVPIGGGSGKIMMKPSNNGRPISVTVPKNEDPNSNPTYTLYIYSRYTANPSNSSNMKDNTDFFALSTVIISQGSAAAISGFELKGSASGGTPLSDSAFNNISKEGCQLTSSGRADTTNPPGKFWIMNVGNTSASYKVSVDNTGKGWIKVGMFPNSDQEMESSGYSPKDSIDVPNVKANSTQGIYFTVAKNTSDSVPRSGEIIIRQTDPAGGDEKRVTVTQMAGNRNFDFSYIIDSTQNRDAQIRVVGDTLIGTVTNTGIVTTDYIVSFSSPYDNIIWMQDVQNGKPAGVKKNTISKSGVKGGESFKFAMVFDVNRSTDIRSGISLTVQDQNEYGLYQTTNFTQEAFNEPGFNLTVKTNTDDKTAPLNQNHELTGGNSVKLYFTMSGWTDSDFVKKYTSILDQNTVDTYRLRWDAATDSGYAGTMTIGGVSNITWPQKSSVNGFVLNIPENTGIDDQYVTVTVNCYYDDANVRSDKYNKSTPFSRTFSFIVKSSLKPAISFSDYGDSYITTTSGPIYMFGPGAGVRSFSVRESHDAPSKWTVNASNVAYAMATPDKNSPYTTVKTGYASEWSATDGVETTGNTIYANAECSGNRSNTLTYGTYRFPIPPNPISSTERNIEFNCNDTERRVTIANVFDTNIGGINRSYNIEYTYDISNNIFSVSKSTDGQSLVIIPPVNTSTVSELICDITIYYNWDYNVPDHTKDKTQRIHCVVRPAPEITFTVNPSTYQWACDAKNNLTVNISATAAGNDAMSKLISWTYTRNEYGTDGSEFVIRKGKQDGEDILTIRPPVNPSTTNYKECQIVFEYGYEGSGETKTLTATYTVEPAPAMQIKVEPPSMTFEAGGAGEPFAVALNVTDSEGNELPLPVSWDYEKVESNNADDFIVRQFAEQDFQLVVTPPKNASTERQKKCDITFTCWYSDGDGKKTWSGVGTYIVNPAGVPKWNVNVNESEENDPDVDGAASDDKTRFMTAKGGGFIMDVTHGPGEKSDGLETEWDWSKTEKGTDGDEFIIKRVENTVTVECPANASVLKEKKCVITFTYGYVGSDMRWTDIYTFIVKPNVDIKFEVDPQNKNDIPAGGKLTDKNGDTVDFLELKVKCEGGTDTVLPVEWDFVKDERGTDGDEFTVIRTADRNTIRLIPPTNASVAKSKECTLTFTYGYEGGDVKQIYVCQYTVLPADGVDLVVTPDGAAVEADGIYTPDGGSEGSQIIQMAVLAKGSDNVPTTWSWSKVERGTSGDEFDVRDVAGGISVRMPVNVSVSKQKTCTLTFTYGYADSDVRWTKTSVLTVNPAGDPAITIQPAVPVIAKADGTPIEPDELKNSKTFEIKVDVAGDPDSISNLTTWSWTKVERGTDGDEFYVSDNGRDGLLMRMPENIMAEKQKECVITFTYGYEDGDRTWKTTRTYTVNEAGALTLEIDPNSGVYDALETDGSIGPHIDAVVKVSRSEGKDDDLKTNWTFEKEEVGTAGDEFRVVKSQEGKLWVYVPTNESRSTVKKCTVYVKAYLGTDDSVNAITQTCDYRVSTLDIPLISFDEIPADGNVNNEKISDAYVDGRTDTITLYTRQTTKQYAAYRWEADKQEIEFNGKVVAKIDNISGVFDADGRSTFNLTVNDTELTDEQIIGMFTFTGYDVNDNMSKKIRLQIKQGAMGNYRPQVKTGAAVTQQNAAYLYYNIGIPAYVPAAQQGSFDFGNITDKDGNIADYNRINISNGQCVVTDWGIMIRRKGNDKWIEIWQSKYKDKEFKPILTNPKNMNMYTACLAYTNNMIKFRIDSEYEYKAVIKANYRKGPSDSDKWVKGEIISGDVKSFIYQAFRVEKDPETIRPYFLPKESIAGYLGGCEVKNFFNSKAVAFNRKKNPVITVSNFSNHWTDDNGVKINITDALVDSILHTPAFNAAWAYINDPDNITHAKTEYIKNVILPNIIINADSTVEVWADIAADGMSVTDRIGDGWTKMSNIGTKFETEPDGSKTLTFNITEQHPYCFIMKLKY